LVRDRLHEEDRVGAVALDPAGQREVGNLGEGVGEGRRDSRAGREQNGSYAVGVLGDRDLALVEAGREVCVLEGGRDDEGRVGRRDGPRVCAGADDVVKLGCGGSDDRDVRLALD